MNVDDNDSDNSDHQHTTSPSTSTTVASVDENCLSTTEKKKEKRPPRRKRRYPATTNTTPSRASIRSLVDLTSAETPTPPRIDLLNLRTPSPRICRKTLSRLNKNRLIFPTFTTSPANHCRPQMPPPTVSSSVSFSSGLTETMATPPRRCRKRMSSLNLCDETTDGERFMTPRPKKRMRLSPARGCLSTGQKKSKSEAKSVKFTSVSVHSFQQRAGAESSCVPEEGTALHLGDHITTLEESLDNFEEKRQNERREVFDILSPAQRKSRVKAHSPGDLTRQAIRQEQQELQEIRSSRSDVGCSCLPPSKMTKKAVMESFDLLGIEYDKRSKKQVLIKQLQAEREGNYCCVDKCCSCFSNGIDCHYHAVAPSGCACAKHMTHGRETCANEFGLYRPEVVPFESPAIRKILQNWNQFYDPDASPTQYSKRRGSSSTKRSLDFVDEDTDEDDDDEEYNFEADLAAFGEDD